MGDEQRVSWQELLASSREAFEDGTDLTVAVEEEFSLLDPQTLELTNRFEELQTASRETDFAEHVDCKVIRGMLGAAGGAPFVEGYVVLIVFPSPLTVLHELDVVGVYTVSNRDGQSVDLEMMAAPPRILTFSTAEGTKLRDKMMEAPKDKE